MNEQAAMMNQQQQQMINMNQNLMSMNQMNPHPQQQQPQPQMVPMSRSYGMWAPPPQFQNPNLKFNPNQNPGSMKSAFNKSLGPRSNWKGKKVNKSNDKRRKEQQKSLMVGSSTGGVDVTSGGVGNSNFNSYQPPNLNELQHQNRLKTRKFFPKRNFNKNNGMNMDMYVGGNFNKKYSAPHAPRNTTSFLIRAKKSGGLATLVSPCPVTPAVLPTPIFSPSREVLVDTAKEEWGVDGYGSMKGLIRLRSPGHEMEAHEDEEEDEGGSSESDVEEHVEVERRLDHDLSRFEMIYNPNTGSAGGMDYHNVLENRVDDHDTHIAHLEDENLILKERLFLMERELGDLRRRMQSLERRRNGGEEINEEVVENESENDSESRGEEAHSIEDNNEDFSDNCQGDGFTKGKFDDGNTAKGFEAAAATTENNLVLDVEGKVGNNDNNGNIADFKVNKEDNNDEFIEANNADEKVAGVEDTKGKNNDENKLLDVEVKAEDNVDVESSETVMVGDICMEEVGVVKDDMVMEKDIAN
ncbi:hypothetical protein ACJIZ3_011947 [Penstemon smallii]|uniref:PRLI-interacting factor A n=1 Tax=Penstemon smallii TaxID=265156 RepID=A0ABD3ULY0_9LAMI